MRRINWAKSLTLALVFGLPLTLVAFFYAALETFATGKFPDVGLLFYPFMWSWAHADNLLPQRFSWAAVLVGAVSQLAAYLGIAITIEQATVWMRRWHTSNSAG